jgi:hypothetical protein
VIFLWQWHIRPNFLLLEMYCTKILYFPLIFLPEIFSSPQCFASFYLLFLVKNKGFYRNYIFSFTSDETISLIKNFIGDTYCISHNFFSFVIYSLSVIKHYLWWHSLYCQQFLSWEIYSLLLTKIIF